MSFKSLCDGGTAVSPLLLGVVPFGMIFGAAAVESGLSLAETAGMSLIVFAGASQLVVVHLLGENPSMAVLLITGLVINLRMLMYSASLAPHLGTYPVRRRAVLSYFLTDQAYAVSIARFSAGNEGAVSKGWYYLGAGLVMWAGFQISTLLGALLGELIPPSLDLGFAVPLTFIALTLPVVRDRPCLWAAVSGGGTALAAAGLPYNFGLLLGAATGICVGCLAEKRSGRRAYA